MAGDSDSLKELRVLRVVCQARSVMGFMCQEIVC
jgi:hypothetical protein